MNVQQCEAPTEKELNNIYAWGVWQRGALKHLGYAKINDSKSKTFSASIEDIVETDRLLALVKKEDRSAFEIIKYRYAYGETLKELASRLNYKTIRPVMNKLDQALSKFVEIKKCNTPEK